MYFETSRDLFFFALAIATVVLTALFAWLLWYLISIIRQAHRVMEDVTRSVEKLQGILDSMRETIANSTSHIALITGAVKQLVGFYRRRHGVDEEDEESDEPAPKRKRR